MLARVLSSGIIHALGAIHLISRGQRARTLYSDIR